MHARLSIFKIESIHYDCSIANKNFQPAWHSRNDLKSLGHDLLYWQEGKLYLITANEEEIHKQPLLYAHFQKRAMGNEVIDTKRFCIVKNKFINIDEPSTPTDIINLSPRPIIDFTRQKRFIQRLRRKLLPNRGVSFFHWPPSVIEEKDRLWDKLENS